jgi:hypothetical protein
MVRKASIALALTVAALAATSAINSAWAFSRFWPAVPFYYIPY